MSDELIVPTLDMTDVAGVLQPSSKRIYKHDMLVFAQWIQEQELTPALLTRSHMILFRAYLLGRYARSTAQRVFSVASRILQEQVYNGVLPKNPAEGIKGITAQDETTHTALTTMQIKEMLTSIDITTKKGLRDYTIIKLMARTGLRRSECAKIRLCDLTQDQGHHILLLPETKSKQRQLVKIPVDIDRLLEDYKERVGLEDAEEDQRLFVGFDRGDTPTKTGISDKTIWRIVKVYATRIGVKLSPHGLRATFITLTLEENVPLHKVQYAARHRDPRTTERYHKRKINLDDNAVDFLKF